MMGSYHIIKDDIGMLGTFCQKLPIILYNNWWCHQHPTTTPAALNLTLTLPLKPCIHPSCNSVAAVSSVVSQLCCNTIHAIIHPPCNNYKLNNTTHTLRLLQDGCMIVLQQPLLITIESCNIVLQHCSKTGVCRASLQHSLHFGYFLLAGKKGYIEHIRNGRVIDKLAQIEDFEYDTPVLTW